MKSITTKLSVAMILCMMAAVLLVSTIHITKATEINEAGSQTIMQLICQNNAQALDAQMAAIERSVDLLSKHSAVFLFDESVPLEDRIRDLQTLCMSTAEYTREAISIYFHCNPDKYDSNFDFIFARNPQTGEFEPGEAAHPYSYTIETGLAADWYYTSARTRQPAWLKPNLQSAGPNGEEMVVASYTVPLCDERGELLGVIGMGYTLADLFDELSRIRIYDTGYAFLTATDGTMLMHPQFAYGTQMLTIDPRFVTMETLLEDGQTPGTLYSYELGGVQKQLTFAPLRNGTCLVVTAPTSEINASIKRMAAESQTLFAVVMVSTVMIIYCIVYRFIHPLQLLTHASQQIIKGNMQVELSYNAPDEIGELTRNFRQMARHLQEYISKINTMAYTDAMTGLKNKTAYQSAVHLLQERMEQGDCTFGVVVFDLNNLKQVNDTLGHTAGDRLISNAGKLIARAFAHSPVFRIGGDEFVVILENEDFAFRDRCMEDMDRLNRKLNAKLRREEQVCLACGMALYQPERDTVYRDVFTRADQQMYQNKQQMKSGQRPAGTEGRR